MRALGNRGDGFAAGGNGCIYKRGTQRSARHRVPSCSLFFRNKTAGDEENEGAITILQGAIICEKISVLSLHGTCHDDRVVSGRDA